MNRKAVVKSIEFPELTVSVVGNNAIVRHLRVSESEQDGKVTLKRSACCRSGKSRVRIGSPLARASLPAAAARLAGRDATENRKFAEFLL
jgi:hypothetical protein